MVGPDCPLHKAGRQCYLTCFEPLTSNSEAIQLNRIVKGAAYPPPPGALGAGEGLADLNEDPPTLPPDLAASASSGEPALMMRAAATAAVRGKANRLTAESA